MDEGRVVRREGFLDARAIAALLRNPEQFDPEPVMALARETLGATRSRGVELHTLGPGEWIENRASGDAAGGFLLDLDPPEWLSQWGGLLLFAEAGGERLYGYRPVPGDLTLFSAEARPAISLIVPQAPRRVSLLGWWD